MDFCINRDTHLLAFIDNTKEGVILKDQTTTTHIWLLNTLYDYLEINGTLP